MRKGNVYMKKTWKDGTLNNNQHTKSHNDAEKRNRNRQATSDYGSFAEERSKTGFRRRYKSETNPTTDTRERNKNSQAKPKKETNICLREEEGGEGGEEITRVMYFE